MIKKLAVLSCALLLCLSGCRPSGETTGTSVTTSSGTATSTTTSATQKPTETTSTAATGQTDPEPADIELSKYDLSAIPGMILERVFLRGQDDALLFMRPETSQGWSENMSLYSLKLSNGEITGPVELGTLGQFPTVIFDDGSVSVITEDPESYLFSALVIINPDLSLEKRTYDYPGVYSVVLSPDKAFTAVNAENYAVLLDKNGRELLRLERDEADPGDITDDRLPMIASFTSDSKKALINYQGWEWIYHSSLYDITSGTEQKLENYFDAALHTMGDKLILLDMRTGMPLGIFHPESGLMDERKFDYVEDWAFCLSAFGLHHGALCFEGDRYVVVSLNDELNVTGELICPEGMSFSSISISPDGRTAALVTTHTVDKLPELYIAPLY